MSDGEFFALFMVMVIWVAFAVIVGQIAKRRGREASDFFFAALFLSPLIALIILIAIPIVIPPDPQKTQCPHCHGLVDRDVECCMHCARDINWGSKAKTSRQENKQVNVPALVMLPLLVPSDTAQRKEDVSLEKDTGNSLQLQNTRSRPSAIVPLVPYEVECPECRKTFSVKSNRGIVEDLCPHCQAILKLDTAVA